MTLTLSPEIERAVTAAAARQGTTPEQIVTEMVQEKFVLPQDAVEEGLAEPKQTLAEALAGHIGTQSSGRGDLSQKTGKAFARPSAKEDAEEVSEQEPTLAELFAGRTGLVDSEGKYNYSSHTGKAYAESLLKQKEQSAKIKED